MRRKRIWSTVLILLTAACSPDGASLPSSIEPAEASATDAEAANRASNPVAPIEDAAPSGPAPRSAPTPVPTSSAVLAAVDNPLLLPDLNRWVVVADWTDASQPGGVGQVDFAPIDADGIAALGHTMQMTQIRGTLDDLDRRFGDAASLAPVTELRFVVAPGIEAIGKAAENDDLGLSVVALWAGDTLVNIQTQDRSLDVVEFAMSLRVVDSATWDAARNEVTETVAAAVNAALADRPAIDHPTVEPLPHFVPPEPWEIDWVTDMTIWSPEQHAQRRTFAELMRPATDVAPPISVRSWFFGVDRDLTDRLEPFSVAIEVTMSRFEDPPDDFVPANYDAVDVGGLPGHTYPGSTTVEVHDGTTRIWIRGHGVGATEVDEFIDTVQFVSADPFDGVVTGTPEFVELDFDPPADKPASWHAAWKHPDGLTAHSSVWRLDVDGLRWWVMTRGDGTAVPPDIWTQLATGATVELAPTVVYQPDAQLLVALNGPRSLSFDDFEPIDLTDWIALVEPHNADPLSPR